jgi:hypothetical protein
MISALTVSGDGAVPIGISMDRLSQHVDEEFADLEFIGSRRVAEALAGRAARRPMPMPMPVRLRDAR